MASSTWSSNTLFGWRIGGQYARLRSKAFTIAIHVQRMERQKRLPSVIFRTEFLIPLKDNSSALSPLLPTERSKSYFTSHNVTQHLSYHFTSIWYAGFFLSGTCRLIDLFIYFLGNSLYWFLDSVERGKKNDNHGRATFDSLVSSLAILNIMLPMNTVAERPWTFTTTVSDRSRYEIHGWYGSWHNVPSTSGIMKLRSYKFWHSELSANTALLLVLESEKWGFFFFFFGGGG